MMLWSVIPTQLARLIFSAFGASSRHVTPASTPSPFPANDTPFQQKRRRRRRRRKVD